MTREISQLPLEITDFIFERGSRKLVFLEGDDDLRVFKTWFQQDLSRIYFFAAGGCSNVKRFLQETLEHSTKKKIYGIIDRDFRTEEEVKSDKTENLFILTRYAIENYLLEADAVCDTLGFYPFTVPNLSAMKIELLEQNIFQKDTILKKMIGKPLLNNLPKS